MTLKLLRINLVLFGAAQALVSLDGHTGRLPAMGWNSWNEYQCGIDETLFLEISHLLVSLGLKGLGYNYVNIDDCWSDKVNQRDHATGKIRPDAEKFPHGLKHTADEIHKLGLKLGIYGDAGTLTCAGYAGSLGYEQVDAQTFAEWGIDYLKYDNCYVPGEWSDEYRWRPENWRGGPLSENVVDARSRTIPAPDNYDWKTSKTFSRYERMRDALLATGRSIEYSQCAWGHARIDQWGNSTGHSWRMTDDITPSWDWGVMPILNHASFFVNTTNFWGHGDWDMLEVGNGDLTVQESRSHFALWAALKSPLIIGTRLHNIKPEILQILSNKELIDFNQDPLEGEPAKPYKWGVNPNFTWNQTHPAEYWSGVSSKGVHVFVLNTLDVPQIKNVDFGEVPGLDPNDEYTVFDSWTGQAQGRFKGGYAAWVDTHDTMAIRLLRADARNWSVCGL